jgi:aerobic-type carbon monoxide dehydrogenase small subunit (CoxS/CutS family)
MHMETRTVRVVVNGTAYEHEVEPRRMLGDFLRHDLNLTGTHYGCEHGVCGACTVLIEGRTARACLTLAAQVNGRSLTTVEGLAHADGTLNVLQQAFTETHALQCGFCTPGMLMTLTDRSRDPRSDHRQSVPLYGLPADCRGGPARRAAHPRSACRRAGSPSYGVTRWTIPT